MTADRPAGPGRDAIADDPEDVHRGIATAPPSPLVVFGEDWGAHPSSTQHLVRRLRDDRTVVWVNSIGLRRPRPTIGDAARAVRKVGAAISGRLAATGQPAHPDTTGRFQVVAPIVVPVATRPWLRAINRRLLAAAVGRAGRRLGLREPILWLSLPTGVDAIGAVGERAVVYYCCDDWSSMVGVDGGPVQRLEAELARRADLVLAASPALAEKFPPAKTRLVPHGVDAEAFGRDRPRPPDLPDDRPVAGFYGSLSDWIDLDLLVQVARDLPDWRLVLIGPQRTDLTALRSLPNVVLAGPRPHQALPGYVQHWDVSLLPFRDTPQIRACNPLKLREYLAAGRPVVATDFPALDGYRDLVEVARSPEQFVQAIRRAGAEAGRLAGERRRRVAGETWEARARAVSDLLAGL